MNYQMKPLKNKQLKAQLTKEFNFIKDIFSVISLPIQARGEQEDMDFEIVNDNPKTDSEKELPKRARNIIELEEKLEKLKSLKKFNLKNKLVKKSLTSKLNKKIKKRERLNNTKVKLNSEKLFIGKENSEEKPKVNSTKPVFNNDGKLVFSKFDFADDTRGKGPKSEKDPKKLLENLKLQQQKIHQLEETEDSGKVKEMKEKMAWKTILQKAEGQKIKDDPILLKKSIKKMDQKKKQSKKQWDDRIKNVEQKREDRQKKRKENISKKKKEKKSKIVKTAVKRGRVVI